jgi:hypothetical protein
MSGGDWRDAADHGAVEARRWKAIMLANRGLTYRQVAEELVDEYRLTSGNPSLTVDQVANQVGVDIHRALKVYRQRTDAEVEDRIAAQVLRFNDIRRALYGVIARRHLVVNNGKIITDAEGVPLRDDGPVIAAVAQLIQLEDRQARVEGTYAREKLDIALETRVENEAQLAVEAILAGADAIDLEPVQRQRMLEAAGARLRTIDGEVVSESEDEG